MVQVLTKTLDSNYQTSNYNDCTTEDSDVLPSDTIKDYKVQYCILKKLSESGNISEDNVLEYLKTICIYHYLMEKVDDIDCFRMRHMIFTDLMKYIDCGNIKIVDVFYHPLNINFLIKYGIISYENLVTDHPHNILLDDKGSLYTCPKNAKYMDNDICCIITCCLIISYKFNDNIKHKLFMYCCRSSYEKSRCYPKIFDIPDSDYQKYLSNINRPEILQKYSGLDTYEKCYSESEYFKVLIEE